MWLDDNEMPLNLKRPIACGFDGDKFASCLHSQEAECLDNTMMIFQDTEV